MTDELNLFDAPRTERNASGSADLIDFDRGFTLEVLKTLRGGMGVIHLGTLKEAGDTDTLIAVKTIQPKFLLDAKTRGLFETELATWARVGSPAYVLPLMDIWRKEGIPYAVTLAVSPGEDGCVTVHDRIAQSVNGLAPDQTLQIALCVALGMRAACARVQDLVHADIKPENILLLDGVAYITDFGLARVAASIDTGFGGTPAYMAPECFSNGGWCTTRDIYAFGCTLYECLTGTPPFGIGDVEELARKHASVSPPLLNSVGEPNGLYGALATLAIHCLAKDPEARPSTFLQVVNSLKEIAEQYCSSEMDRFWIFAEQDGLAEFTDGMSLAARVSGMLEAGNVDVALQLLDTIPLGERSAELVLLTGSSFSLSNRDEEALDLFEILLTQEMSTKFRERCLNAKGLSLRRLNRLDEAIKVFESLLDASDSAILEGAQANLAGTLLESDKPEDAYQRVSRLVRDNQRNPMLWALQGQILLKIDSTDRAIASFERALALDPHLLLARLELADALVLYCGDPIAAFAQLDLAFDLGHHTPELISRMIALATILERNDVANGLLEGLKSQPEEVTHAIITVVREHLVAWKPALTQIAPNANTTPPANASRGRLKSRFGSNSEVSSASPSALPSDPTLQGSPSVPMVVETALLLDDNGDENGMVIGCRVYTGEQVFAADFFADPEHEGYAEIFANALQTLKTQVLPQIANVDLRSSVFRFVACTNCGAVALSNRVASEQLLCRRCDSKGPIVLERDELRENLLAACELAANLKRNDLRGQTIVFALWPTTPEHHDQACQFLEERGFEAYDPESIVAKMATTLARQNGLVTESGQTAAFRLVLTEPTPGYKGTPWPVQEALVTLRRMIGQLTSLSITLEEAQAKLVERGTLDAIAEDLVAEHGNCPTDPQALATMIKVRTGQKDLNEAANLVAFSSQISNADHNDLEAARGEYYLAAGDLSAAIAALERAKAADPLATIVRLTLIKALQKAGDAERAEKEVLQAQAIGLRLGF